MNIISNLYYFLCVGGCVHYAVAVGTCEVILSLYHDICRDVTYSSTWCKVFFPPLQACHNILSYHLNRLWYIIQSSYKFIHYPISACIWHNAFTRQARRTPISPIFMTTTGSLNPSRILTTRTHSTGIAATVFCLLSVLHSIDSPPSPC